MYCKETTSSNKCDAGRDDLRIVFPPWDSLSYEISLNGIFPIKALIVARILLDVEFLSLLKQRSAAIMGQILPPLPPYESSACAIQRHLTNVLHL